MQFLNVAIPALAAILFTAPAVGDEHPVCWCNNGDSYNWVITKKTCEKFPTLGIANSDVYYDGPSGHCIARAGSYMEGADFQNACRDVASIDGFTCGNGQGTCYTNHDDASADCYK